MVRTAVEKTARAFSDGSGTFARAVMLPWGKTRSETNFMATLCCAMLVAAGPCHLNEEHHVEMGTVSLDRTPYNLKQMTVGVGGNNSIWVSASFTMQQQMDVAACSWRPTSSAVRRDVMGLRFQSLRHVKNVTTRFKSLALEKRLLSTEFEADADDETKTLGQDVRQKVQVLLVCEKSLAGNGAKRIQVHGNRPDNAIDACGMEDNETEMAWCSNQCSELATLNNSTV